MNVEIAGRHIPITEAIRAHVREKLSHLDKYSDRVRRVRATLFTEADQNVAEILASVTHSAPLVAEARSPDMYKAIDAAVAKVEHQVRRQKERAMDRRTRSRAGKAPPSPEEESSTEDEWEEPEPEEPEEP